VTHNTFTPSHHHTYTRMSLLVCLTSQSSCVALRSIVCFGLLGCFDGKPTKQTNSTAMEHV
jgi:hypothetical protein